jgi:hypothetical protein
MNEGCGRERHRRDHGLGVEASEFAIEGAERGDRRGLSAEIGDTAGVELDDRETLAGSDPANDGHEHRTGEARDEHGGLRLEDEAGHGERYRGAWPSGEGADATDLPGVEGREGDLPASFLEEEQPGIPADGVMFEHRGRGSGHGGIPRECSDDTHEVRGPGLLQAFEGNIEGELERAFETLCRVLSNEALVAVEGRRIGERLNEMFRQRNISC